MSLAYLITVYPKGSHTFIRRELAAIEARGFAVERFTLRPSDETLVDPDDLAERRRTRSLTAGGLVPLAGAMLGTAVSRPRRFLAALKRALRLGWGSDRGVPKHLVYLMEACRLRAWLARSGAVHVHAHFGTNSAAVALLCRDLGGPPYSLTVHGQEEFDKPEAMALGEKVNNAVFTATVSRYGKAQLHRWTPKSAWPRIHVVRCGVDGQFLGLETPPITEAPRLVFVGRFDLAKGLLQLVEATARLVAWGLKPELVLIGDGPDRPQVAERIEQLGLGEFITLTGWMGSRDVREQVLRARALVLPSFAENLPLVVMEALALGRPVVATQVGAMAEAVRPGVSGWLVPPTAVDELADALREVLHTPPEVLERMGRAGAALIAERHDARLEAGRLAELFLAHTAAVPTRETSGQPEGGVRRPAPSEAVAVLAADGA